ncbi:MAG TPA: SsrA-binding protein SmpB [Tissierellaceae bacterium]
MKKDGIKTVATNRKARHEYFIEDTYEAGIALTGTEVKSVRQGRVNIKDSYATVDRGEVYINNMHISPYEQGNIYNVDPLRKRKLLLHKREIRKLEAAISQKGYTLIPLSVYLKNGLVKIELAIAKGKKLYDKRDDIARKEAERRMLQHTSLKYQ